MNGPASRPDPRVALVAGEASGDLLAGLLLAGMRQRWPDLRSQGIGGPQMARHGFEAWWPYEKLAVRGYVEVLKHYREIVGIRDQLRERLLADPPAAFIGVAGFYPRMGFRRAGRPERDPFGQPYPILHLELP